jgi:hypothetical protein
VVWETAAVVVNGSKQLQQAVVDSHRSEPSSTAVAASRRRQSSQ